MSSIRPRSRKKSYLVGGLVDGDQVEVVEVEREERDKHDEAVEAEEAGQEHWQPLELTHKPPIASGKEIRLFTETQRD